MEYNMATTSAVTGVYPSVNNMRFANYSVSSGIYQQFRKTSAVGFSPEDGYAAITLPSQDVFSINSAISNPVLSPVNYYTESGNGVPAENPHFHIFARTALTNKAIFNGTFIPYDPHNIDLNFPIPESIDFFYN
jgi:hypothetical protein